MTPTDEFSQGEIGRTLVRLERSLVNLDSKLDTIVEPVSALKVKVAAAEADIIRIDGAVQLVTRDANRIAGAGAVVAFLSTLIPWPWKH